MLVLTPGGLPTPHAAAAKPVGTAPQLSEVPNEPAVERPRQTLEDAWRQALEQNPALRAAALQAEAAGERLDAAQAERLPRLSVDAFWNRLDQGPSVRLDLPIPAPSPGPAPEPGTPPTTPSPTTPLDLRSDDDFTVALGQLSVPLWTSGRIAGGIAAARARADTRELERRAAAQDLKISVADAYLDVLRGERGLAVARDAVESLQAHATVARDLYDHGVIARHDLLSARVSLADARQQRIAAAESLEVARAAYNKVLGRSQDESVSLEDLPTPRLRWGDPRPTADAPPGETGDAAPRAPDPDLATLVRRALENRPRLAALEQRAEALRQRARSLAGEDLPQVSASGAYVHVENDVLDQDAFWAATVGVSWELFDSGRTGNQVRALELEAEATERRRDNLADGVALEVRSAWRDLASALERWEVARQAVDLAEENLEVARDRFANGVGTGTDVLDARTRLTRARSNRDDARYDAIQAELHLSRALGSL